MCSEFIGRLQTRTKYLYCNNKKKIKKLKVKMIHVVGVRTEITQNIGGSLAAVFLRASFTWMIRFLGV